ncbi:MAG: MtrB/PioB family decaheme-associated outer membrane protein [Alphaproteobacteria bacterium]|nr:MtrB/PioB family decaheme-associated outer membrane protein [Alphaproteobacteria bacterium]
MRIIALSGVCLLGLAASAQAQSDNGFDISSAPATPQTQTAQNPSSSFEINLGVGGVTQSSAAFGRYNGMPDSGVGFLGSWDFEKRDPSDSGGTHYLSFTGTDVNFGFGKIAPEASVDFKFGEQGKWGITADYDAMTYFANSDFLSILDKHGNLSPSYQSALVANGLYFTNSTSPPPASAKFGSFNPSTHIAMSSPVTAYGPGNQLSSSVGTRRDKGTVSGTYDVEDWQITAVVSREHKEGSLEQAMTTGGNNAGMVTFPMPINYDTDNFVVAAAYTTPDFQAKFSYSFSNFTDNNESGYAFEGWNFSAFKNTATTPTTYTSYARSGDYALPPSNQAHTVKAELGYNFSPVTRLYGTFVYGLQLQNDPFVDATLNGYVLAKPSLAAQLASNPGSLSGLVQTYFGNATLTSRPLPKLDIKASYSIDARDPQTKPMWIYGNPTDNTSLKYREAVPESWTKQEVALSAGYHILPATRVTVGYVFRDARRSNAITRHTSESEESVKFDSTLATDVTASLGYVHSDRTASAPDYSLWLVQIPSDCGSTLNALGCQQVPFYEAARTEDAVSGMLTAALGQKTSLNLFGKYSDDHYHLPPAVYLGVTLPSVGINHAYTLQGGPDLTYQADEATELHVYYTFLRTYRAMRALNNQDSTTAGGDFYSEASTYDIHTLGVGGTWRASDKLKFGADYVYSYGAQGFVQSGSWDTTEGGQTFGGDPLLNANSGIHQFRIHATYDYSPDTSYYLGYAFDSLDTSDWALVGVTAAQVLTGNVPPKYNVSRIMAGVTLKL